MYIVKLQDQENHPLRVLQKIKDGDYYMDYRSSDEDGGEHDLSSVKAIKFDQKNRYLCLIGLHKFTLINLSTGVAKSYSVN